MTRQKRGVEQRRMICYVATHNDSGKRYVGITKRGLKVRKSQHEKDAMSERNRGPFSITHLENTVKTPSHGKLLPKAKMR